MDRLRRLGLQRRIMLLVTIGMAAMFTVGGVIGLRAIDDAGELIFQERVATAYATVAIVERHLDHLASDVHLMELAARGAAGSDAGTLAEMMLDRVGGADRYTFFTVTGLDILDTKGTPLATVGLPAATDRVPTGAIAAPPAGGMIAVELATWQLPGEVPLADITVALGSPAAGDIGGITLHTVSVNSTDPFSPAAYAGRGAQPDAIATRRNPKELYNLEIVDPGGTTVLSLGTGSEAGSTSAHLKHIADVVSDGSATALVDPGEEGGLAPHVVAAVPMSESPFYLLLEQPVDVALDLPNQLRQRLLLLISIGFVGTWAVAWFTTRRVVKPTEELTRAASRMAQGDLTEPIDVAAQDEIESLAETLELMRQRLLEAQETLEHTNQLLEERVAERTARLGFVLRKTISAQEAERRALARELHDETAQTLGALSIALDRARDDASEGTDDRLRARIVEAKAIAARLLTETRRMIMGLRPSVLDDLGLGPAIAWYAETMLSDRDRQTAFNVDAPDERLPEHIEVALFRITQEAINNVAKHSDATTMSVYLHRDGNDVELSVEDDGVGFDVDEVLGRTAGAGGVGLAGMEERVTLLGGGMEISSGANDGTTIRVRVPVTTEDQ